MWICFIIGGLVIAMGIVLLTGRGAFLVAGYNTASKAEKAKYDEKKLCRNVGKIVLPAGVLTIALGVVIAIGMQEARVEVTDTNVKIGGMYGLTVEFSEITDIQLIESSMKTIGTGVRTNGIGGIGEVNKGYFRTTHYGDAMLFVMVNSSPTIRIVRDERDVFISFSDSEATRALYEELMAKRT